MKKLWKWLSGLFGHTPAPKPTPTPVELAPTEVQPIPVVQTIDLSVVTSVTNSDAGEANVPLPSPAPPVVPSPISLPPASPSPVLPVGPEIADAPTPIPVPTAPGSNPSPVPAPALPSPTPTSGPAPTFADDFSLGYLDTSKWIPSNWGAPGGGVFRPEYLDFSTGCLRLRVSQSLVAGAIVSTGGELQSKLKFGFGTYEWVMRAASTSPTPDGPGTAVSGQISSGFLYLPNSETEIDCPEIEGDKPDQLSWTSWQGTSRKEYTATQAEYPPEAGFHSYKTVWNADKIAFYFDDVLQTTHTTVVPTAPAYAMINLWGTDSDGWGGKATPGVDRYMFVRRFSFTPA